METEKNIETTSVIEPQNAVDSEESNTLEKKEESDKTDQNAHSLAKEISWFSQIVNTRLDQYFNQNKNIPSSAIKNTGNTTLFSNIFGTSKTKKETKSEPSVSSMDKDVTPVVLPPDLAGDHSIYADFVRHYQLSPDERIILILGLIPHVQPHLLDVFFAQNKTINRGYTEFGGIVGKQQSGFIPTLETALFILAGNDLALRFEKYWLFETDHIFSMHNIMNYDQGQSNESFFSSAIHLSDEYIDFFTKGVIRRPSFSIEFPAKQLTTQMEWEDLVVDEVTARQLDEIRIWLQHGKTLYEDWGMSKKLKPGYKALFHGPPGTGKTLTASLLGKLFNLEVYRIDLSMVISKYIGETEKNLEKVFKKAENKNWILFFDEADSLFGKRTSISDSHDKYANQEIAYLLQRLEDFPGLVILASNMRSNVDEAFTRRLQSIVHFQKPQARERLKIWNNAFSTASQPPAKEELERIANQYELSGGSIMNVVQFTSLIALNRSDNVITVKDITEGIRKEFKKEGKIF